MKLSETLRERGYVYQHSSEKLEEITDGPTKRTLYLGVDPTADSMHVGQLQGILVLRRFIEDGHKLIIIIGAGTGMVGDPGGKTTERKLLSDEEVDRNAEALKKQFIQLLGGDNFQMVNNADWLRKIGMMEFLRDVGKHFTVNEMIKRDSVRPRLETPDASISYTEFSYMLLQAYDFLHLNREFGCDLQVGGSDQWGNIVSGVDLIRRVEQKQAYAFSWPLLVDKSTGKKFGKSEGKAVWLDAMKTSPFQFYQFWLNTEDNAVEEFLLKMTMMQKAGADSIDLVMNEHQANPASRIAQRKLAFEITKLTHGEDVAHLMSAIAIILFGDGMSEVLEPKIKEALMNEAPNCKIDIGENIIDVLVKSELASSKREAREFVEQNAISINGEKISDVSRTINNFDIKNGFALLKRGKQRISLLTLA